MRGNAMLFLPVQPCCQNDIRFQNEIQPGQFLLVQQNILHRHELIPLFFQRIDNRKRRLHA